MARKAILIFSVFVLTACAMTIPATTRMNESLMANIKTSTVKEVGFEYVSYVKDDVIKPCAKDSRTINNDHPGYVHSESTMLKKLLTEYMAMKFPIVGNGTDPKIKVILKDFWIEQYSLDSTGKRVLVALGGGEINISVVSNLELIYELSKDGTTVKKSVRVSADNVHVMGIGTGTETSRIHRGTRSIEFDIAEAINRANNKAVVMLNQFIDSMQ